MHQFFMGKLPEIFDSFFIRTSDKHNVNTHFATKTIFLMFQKFEQTMVKCNIRYNGPTLIGIKLMRDNLKILTPYSFYEAFH